MEEIDLSEYGINVKEYAEGNIQDYEKEILNLVNNLLINFSKDQVELFLHFIVKKYRNFIYLHTIRFLVNDLTKNNIKDINKIVLLIDKVFNHNFEPLKFNHLQKGVSYVLENNITDIDYIISLIGYYANDKFDENQVEIIMNGISSLLQKGIKDISEIIAIIDLYAKTEYDSYKMYQILELINVFLDKKWETIEFLEFNMYLFNDEVSFNAIKTNVFLSKVLDLIIGDKKLDGNIIKLIVNEVDYIIKHNNKIDIKQLINQVESIKKYAKKGLDAKRIELIKKKLLNDSYDERELDFIANPQFDYDTMNVLFDMFLVFRDKTNIHSLISKNKFLMFI